MRVPISFTLVHSVHSPSDLLKPLSIASNVSGEVGQEGTAMGDQDGEPWALGDHGLDPLIRHIQTMTDIQLLQ